MILASKSPRRKEILENFGFKFTIDVPDIEENSLELEVVEQIKDIARKKALEVASRNVSEYIVSADTVVEIDNRVLGKPKNEEEAGEMLEMLSGKTHRVITAYSFINLEKNIEITEYSATDVKFKKLSQEMISWYIGTKEPMDKAGAYGIQEKGAILVESIQGDFFTVMGFPISNFIQKLLEIGISLENISTL